MYADEMTSYPEIINVVERVFRMQNELPALRNEVATASDELTRADGLKKTVARCRLKDAEAALAAKMEEIDCLGTSIPAPFEIPCSKTIERIALLRINRDSSKKVVDLAKSRMDAETAKGAWRPKGAKPPLSVLYVQKEMDIAVAALEKIDSEIKSLTREVDVAEEQRLTDEEMGAWIRGDGPRPRVLVERDRKEWEEFNRTATRLVVPRRVKGYSIV
jgi:hypothetical protein